MKITGEEISMKSENRRFFLCVCERDWGMNYTRVERRVTPSFHSKK